MFSWFIHFHVGKKSKWMMLVTTKATVAADKTSTPQKF